MSLSNASIVTAPSSIAPTGGSALVFSSSGNLSNGKVTLIVSADTDLRIRRSIDATIKNPSPSLSAPNGYTQARVSFVYKKPKLLANGKITVNTARVEFSYDVETTQTEIQELADVAAQMCFDGDFVPSIKTLTLT